MGEAQSAGDFRIRQSGAGPVLLDLFPVQFPNRIATAHLVIVAEFEDEVAIGLQHCLGCADLRTRKASGQVLRVSS